MIVKHKFLQKTFICLGFPHFWQILLKSKKALQYVLLFYKNIIKNLFIYRIYIQENCPPFERAVNLMR